MATFKGAISFGLVYIPIRLSVGVKAHDIGFNLLDKKTMSRIKYKKTCVDCQNREVKNEDIVKGYMYEKDKYVLFSEKDFEKIKSPQDENIVIQQFIDIKEIDPLFFDKSYYAIPTGAEKAFHVLLQAMEKQQKAGIAKTVFGTKETLVLIRAYEGNMLITTLYFQNEIQKKPDIKKVKVDKKELDLAIHLIQQMSAPFAPDKFKDEYHDKIKKAIKRKIAGQEIVETKEKKAPVQAINLMEALQKSLGTSSRSSKRRTSA